MTYLSLGSPHCEFIRWTFSVMFAIVRSLRTGTVDLLGAVEDAMSIWLTICSRA